MKSTFLNFKQFNVDGESDLGGGTMEGTSEKESTTLEEETEDMDDEDDEDEDEDDE